MNKSNKNDLIKLPIKVDLVKSAGKKLTYKGIYPQQLFKRLSESVISIDSDVNSTLEFGIDHQKKSFLNGTASLKITQCCQRCNIDFSSELNVDFLLTPVKDLAQTDVLPEGYEPILVDEWGEVDLVHSIEDELLLALPISPMHNINECVIDEAVRTFGTIEDEQPKENPFAVLAKLKKEQ